MGNLNANLAHPTTTHDIDISTLVQQLQFKDFISLFQQKHSWRYTWRQKCTNLPFRTSQCNYILTPHNIALPMPKFASQTYTNPTTMPYGFWYLALNPANINTSNAVAPLFPTLHWQHSPNSLAIASSTFCKNNNHTQIRESHIRIGKTTMYQRSMTHSTGMTTRTPTMQPSLDYTTNKPTILPWTLTLKTWLRKQKY